jgi:hypothetical protein
MASMRSIRWCVGSLSLEFQRPREIREILEFRRTASVHLHLKQRMWPRLRRMSYDHERRWPHSPPARWRACLLPRRP